MKNFDYVCLNCGAKQTFPISDYKGKKVGTMAETFCFACQEITRHMNVGDLKTFLEWNTSKEADLIREILEKKASYGR